MSLFRASGFEGTPTETEEAVPLWFSLDQIPYDEMWADDLYWLPQLLKNQTVFGRFIFDGDQMIDHQIQVSG